MHQFIYNVLIGKVSVGMTFDPAEAHKWLSSSMFAGEREIRKVPYHGKF